MPEVVSCPKCQRKSRVPDTLVGKKVKCPGCAEIFTAIVNAPAPAKKEAEAKKRQEDEDEGGGYEVVDDKKKKKRSRDDDDEDERVSDKPRGRRSRADDDDDEDDDDRPRRSRRSRADDDDDDDDDRVTTRRRRRGRYDDDDDDDDDIDDSDRGPRRRRGGLAADWGRVYRGLSLVLASVVCQILLSIVAVIVLIAIVGMAFGAMAPGPGGAPGGAGNLAGATVGVIVLGLLVIVGSLAILALKITGHYFCLPSPDAYGARPLAIVTLVLALTQGACTLLQWLISLIVLGSAGFEAVANPMAFGAASNALSTVIGWINALAGLGLFFVFLFYLRALALATGNTSLARNIVTYVIVVLVGPFVLILVSCIGMFVMAAGAAAAQGKAGGGGGNPVGAMAAMGATGIVCMGIWAVAFLGLFIWWIMILVQTRAAVGARVRG